LGGRVLIPPSHLSLLWTDEEEEGDGGGGERRRRGDLRLLFIIFP